jgi:hypothetical protein
MASSLQKVREQPHVSQEHVESGNPDSFGETQFGGTPCGSTLVFSRGEGQGSSDFPRGMPIVNTLIRKPLA